MDDDGWADLGPDRPKPKRRKPTLKERLARMEEVYFAQQRTVALTTLEALEAKQYGPERLVKTVEELRAVFARVESRGNRYRPVDLDWAIRRLLRAWDLPEGSDHPRFVDDVRRAMGDDASQPTGQ